ncbi:TPA: hypothetical protein JBJ22_12100 [Legionella pneumophila]|nr:hypothetical protein [Legionella pneumophila]
MPTFSDIIKDKEGKKKFQKKNYRPWDLSGKGKNIVLEEIEGSSSNKIETHKFSSQNSEQAIIDAGKGTSLDTNKVNKDEHLGTIKVQTRDPLDTDKGTIRELYREQLDTNLDPTTLENSILRLSGIQKNIFNFLFDICSTRNICETGPIETATIALCARTTIGGAKGALKHLINKGFIERKEGKRAKGGYVNFGIPQIVYDTTLRMRENGRKEINPAELINSIRYQIENKQIYSSNSILENITTNNKSSINKNDLPPEWKEIDFSDLSHIGFTNTQIKQLIDRNEPELVQQSINHFAYGLEHNQKLKKYEDPLNVLMGVLRKGQGWYEKDYKSPKEIAQERLLELKRIEMEKKRHMEEQAYTMAFKHWEEDLTPEEMEKIAPTLKSGIKDLTPRNAKLSLFFKENVWPSLKKEFIPYE